ncbi:MAG: general secretion pathway protein GspK [Candidatus Glassbacteria bacterium]
MRTNTIRKREAGIALVLTLWVITILMVTATYFAHGRRWDTRLASNFKESTFSYYLARSAVAKTRVLLANEEEELTGRGFDFVDGILEIPEEEVSGGYMSAVVSDLERKVNINKAPFQLLRSLLINTGCDFEEAERLADCILDWRDVNEERRANGAEDEEYLALPDPYPSKDAPFDSVEELLLVMGMTPEILFGDSALAIMRGEEYGGGGQYLGLLNYVTIYGRGRINVNSADMVVLKSLPGIDEETARYIINRRSEENGEFKNISEITSYLERGGASGDLNKNFRSTLSVHSYYYSVKALGKVGETETRLEAVIYRYGKSSRILPRIVAWQELS